MRVLTLTCVAAVVLACAADAAAPPRLAHADLVTRADRVCDRYAALFRRPAGRSGALGDPAYDAAWIRLFARQRRELGALRPSRRDEPPYRRFLGSLPVMERAARALMDELERRDDERASRRALRRFLLAHASARGAARVLGIRRCPGA